MNFPHSFNLNGAMWHPLSSEMQAEVTRNFQAEALRSSVKSIMFPSPSPGNRQETR